MTSSLLSKLTVGAIGLTCKTFLNIGYCSSVKVNGLEVLLEALRNEKRNQGRGIMTISNHVSALDDPVTWGILPARYYFNSRTTRWVLGASDIMFTNPVFSAFFRKGQVIETFRGNGIFQPAVDLAIEKLNEGAWVHLFGEGKINQPLGKKMEEVAAPRPPWKLLRFKWGVGRILMEAQKPPLIIPMWITGFDQLMPEGRPAPSKFFPKPDVSLSITFGQPVNGDDLKAALRSSIGHDSLTHTHAPRGIPRNEDEGTLLAPVFGTAEELRSEKIAEEGWLGDVISPVVEQHSTIRGNAASGADLGTRVALATKTERIRSAVTAILQRDVEALGRKVLGCGAGPR